MRRSIVRRSSRWLALGLAALVSGCITSPVTLSPSTTPLVPGSYRVLGEARGEAFGVAILGIPISGFRQAGAARDDALASARADALINVAGDLTTLHLFIVTLTWTTVEGQAIKLEAK